MIQLLRFPVKLTFAMLLALFLGFYCNLETPRWAVMTAAIVAGGQAFAAGGDPYAGALRHRGVLRLIGTFLGCIAAIVIMSATIRAPLLMLFLSCVWTGVCVFGSSLIRVSNSYALGLAGYTTLIIIISSYAAGSLELAPRLAIERCSEIFIGIFCSIIADMLFSSRSIKGVIDKEVDDLLLAQFHLLQISLQPSSDQEMDKSWGDLVRRSSAFDVMRAQLRMESSHWKQAIRRMKMLNTLSLTLITQAAETYLIASRHPEYISASLFKLINKEIKDITELRQYLRLVRKTLVDYPPEHIPQTVNNWLTAAYEYLIIAKGIQSNVRISSREQQILQREVNVSSRSAETHHAMLNGIRTFIATFAGVLFWLYSGWNSGSACMIMLAVVTALAMRAPNPLMMAKDFVYGMIVALPVGALYFMFLLPATQQSQLLLALVIASLAMTCGFFIQRRQIGTLGAFIGVLNIIVLSNPMQFSISAFFDSALGQSIGCFVAFMVILLIRDNSRAKTGRKILGRFMYSAVSALTTNPERRRENTLPALYQQLFLLINLFPDDIDKYRLGLKLIISQQRLRRADLPRSRQLSDFHLKLRQTGDHLLAARHDDKKHDYYQQLLSLMDDYQVLLQQHQVKNEVMESVQRLTDILRQYQSTMLTI